MRIPTDALVERQIFFNNKLQIIVSFEPPDGRYKSYLDYLTEDAGEEEIAWDNVEDHIPFVEVVVIRNFSGYYSYKVLLDSPDILESQDWRDIRDETNQALADFELEKYGTKNRLFYPEVKEKEEISRKSKKIVRRKRLTLKLRKEYEYLLTEINELINKEATVSQIARALKTTEKTVKENLYAPHTWKYTPAYLAKAVLLKRPMAKELRLDDISKLDDEILNRGRGKEFPKRKRYTLRKRLVVPLREEEIVAFLGLE